jgi:hypothetical protein
VLSAPIRPTGAGVAYEVTLKFLITAYTCVLAGPSHEALSAWTGRHHIRASPLDKDFVPICVRDHARPIRIGASFIDIVKESPASAVKRDANSTCVSVCLPAVKSSRQTFASGRSATFSPPGR